MEHLNHYWGPGAMPNMASPFRNAATNASQTGCGIMIASEHMPSCSHSSGALVSDVPSSPSSSFEPAVAALQQRPREPTLQQYLAHGHGHNTRCAATAAAATGGLPPLPDGAAVMVPQEPPMQQPPAPPLQQPRRKIGRPIAFTGDPDSKELTDAERRRLKRRAANRESARRVRMRRQEMLCATQARLEKMQGHVLALTARLQQAEAQRAGLIQQVAEWTHKEKAELAGAAPLPGSASKQGPNAAAAAAADCDGAPDGAPTEQLVGDFVAAAAAVAEADGEVCPRPGAEATVTSGALASGGGSGPAPGPAAAARACRTVTTVGTDAGPCCARRLGSGGGGGSVLPPPPPALSAAGSRRPTVVSVTPSTGTMRLTCAALPPAITAAQPAGQSCCSWDPSLAGQGFAYQAPTVPDLLSPGVQDDWLVRRASLDLDVLPLLPTGGL